MGNTSDSMRGYGEESPVPFIEDADLDKFWKEDLYDYMLPSQKGFITDVVYFMRGMEVPTPYTYWSMLWLLSTVVKREVWLKWFPDDVYLNLYVILIGPAGFRKSTTIDDIGMKLVKTYQDFISDRNIRLMKGVNIVRDKTTPEGLLDAMHPTNNLARKPFMFLDDNGSPILDPKTGRPIRYPPTSEVGLMLSEMANSIGKRSYTEGFVEILLGLYNPRDSWDWRTKGEGLRTFPKTYLTLLAATTPTGFKESIPKAATGDGFLSRCALVYQTKTLRRFSMPREVPNGPSMEELARRLAWIAEHSLGEYVLSEEAYAFYDTWYNSYRDKVEDLSSGQGMLSRMYLVLLQVAALLRIQRYDVDDRNIVTINDVKDSIKLIEGTYSLARELMSDIGGDLTHICERILQIIKKCSPIERIELLRKAHTPSDDLNKALEYLAQIGDIEIICEGKKKYIPSKSGKETYRISSLYRNENDFEHIDKKEKERWKEE
jgi:hypothetical protein